jgi:hypothetical protein
MPVILGNHNDSAVNGFFKTIAVLWDDAVKYQIYVILAAIALLAVLPLFVTKMSEATNVVLNITIFCAAAVGGFLIFRLKGSQMGAFAFAAALFIRVCLIFVMESASPDVYMCNDDRARTYRWIRHYDSALLQADEFFYAYHTQAYKNVTIHEFINMPEVMKNAHRTSFLMSRVLGFFGDEFVWLRIVGAFLGACAAAIATLTAEELFRRNTASIISLFSVLAPQTAFYSVRFLKEIWIIFAVSLMVYGFAAIIRNKKFLSAALPIGVSAVMLFWIRFECGLLFIAAIPIAVCFRNKSNPAAKTIAVLSLIFLGMVILFYQFERLSYKAEDMLNKYTTMMQEEGLSKREVLDKIYKSHGPLRLLNIPIALLNPPPRNLHHIIIPPNGLHDIVMQADIWQWWLGLPFLIIGTVIIIDRRTEFLAYLLPYFTVIVVSALLLGGLQPTIYRYRDSLVPVVLIIIGAGIESYITEKKPWKNIILLSVCAMFVLLAVYLYTNY